MNPSFGPRLWSSVYSTGLLGGLHLLSGAHWVLYWLVALCMIFSWQWRRVMFWKCRLLYICSLYPRIPRLWNDFSVCLIDKFLSGQFWSLAGKLKLLFCKANWMVLFLSWAAYQAVKLNWMSFISSFQTQLSGFPGFEPESTSWLLVHQTLSRIDCLMLFLFVEKPLVPSCRFAVSFLWVVTGSCCYLWFSQMAFVYGGPVISLVRTAQLRWKTNGSSPWSITGRSHLAFSSVYWASSSPIKRNGHPSLESTLPRFGVGIFFRSLPHMRTVHRNAALSCQAKRSATVFALRVVVLYTHSTPIKIEKAHSCSFRYVRV